MTPNSKSPGPRTRSSSPTRTKASAISTPPGTCRAEKGTQLFFLLGFLYASSVHRRQLVYRILVCEGTRGGGARGRSHVSQAGGRVHRSAPAEGCRAGEALSSGVRQFLRVPGVHGADPHEPVRSI